MNTIKYLVYSGDGSDNLLAWFDEEVEAIAFAKENAGEQTRVEKAECDLAEDGFLNEIINSKTIWSYLDYNANEFDQEFPEEEPDEFDTEFPESDINDFNGSDDEDFGDYAWEDDNKLMQGFSMREAVDALEENESEVECKCCFELFPKEDCIKTEKGYLCKKCNQELHSHQGTNLDLIDSDPFSLDYEDPRDPEEEEEPEVKEEPVDANEVRKHEAGIEEKLNEDVMSLADQVGNRCLDFWEKQRDMGKWNPHAMAEYNITDPEEYADYVVKNIWTVDDIYNSIKDKVQGEEAEVKKLIDAWVNGSLEYEVESLKEHINDRPADIESDQEYQGADNAVVDCKKYTLVAHSEDEKPVDCKLEKPVLEEPLAGEEVDGKFYEDLSDEEKKALDEEIENLDLEEAKKDDELPVDPEAAKLQVHTMLNDLVADEIEAINGYEEAKAEIMDTPIAHKDNILDTIDHVEDEEKEHVDELISATTEIPFDKESDEVKLEQEERLADEANKEIRAKIEAGEIEEEPLNQEFPEVEEAFTDEDRKYFNDLYKSIPASLKKKLNVEAEYYGDDNFVGDIMFDISLKKDKLEAVEQLGKFLVNNLDKEKYEYTIWNPNNGIKEQDIEGYILRYKDMMLEAEEEEWEEEDYEDVSYINFSIYKKGVEENLKESAPDTPFDSDVKEGDSILIVNMEGEPDYCGRKGKVDHIDSLGQLHGTWGGLAVIPGVDKFDIITDECLKEDIKDDADAHRPCWSIEFIGAEQGKFFDSEEEARAAFKALRIPEDIPENTGDIVLWYLNPDKDNYDADVMLDSIRNPLGKSKEELRKLGIFESLKENYDSFVAVKDKLENYLINDLGLDVADDSEAERPVIIIEVYSDKNKIPGRLGDLIDEWFEKNNIKTDYSYSVGDDEDFFEIQLYYKKTDECLKEDAKAPKYKAVVSLEGTFCGEKRVYKNDRFHTYEFDHKPTKQEVEDRFYNDPNIIRLKNWKVSNVRKEVRDFMDGAYDNDDGWKDIKITGYKLIKETLHENWIIQPEIGEKFRLASDQAAINDFRRWARNDQQAADKFEKYLGKVGTVTYVDGNIVNLKFDDMNENERLTLPRWFLHQFISSVDGWTIVHEGLEESRKNVVKYKQVRAYETKANFDRGNYDICEEDNDGSYFDELVADGKYYAVVLGKFSCQYGGPDYEGDEEHDDHFVPIKVWPNTLNADHLVENLNEETVYGLYLNNEEKPLEVGNKKEIDEKKKHLEEVSPEDSQHNKNKYVVKKIGNTSWESLDTKKDLKEYWWEDNDPMNQVDQEEDDVDCGWCGETYPKSECKHEQDFGYLCPQCEAELKSRGEQLVFIENEDLEQKRDEEKWAIIIDGEQKFIGSESEMKDKMSELEKTDAVVAHKVELVKGADVLVKEE